MEYFITHKLSSKEREKYEKKGLYCYDLRDSDIGNDIASIEKYVLVNNIGSIITDKEIELGNTPMDDFVDYEEFIAKNDFVSTIQELIKAFYENKALSYVEKYGITDYKVKNNLLIYYQKSFDNGYSNKPLKYKFTLNLDTMKGEEKGKLLYKRKGE